MISKIKEMILGSSEEKNEEEEKVKERLEALGYK